MAEAAVLHDAGSGPHPQPSSTDQPDCFSSTANFAQHRAGRCGGRREISPARRRARWKPAIFRTPPTSRISPSTTLMPGETFKSRTIFALLGPLILKGPGQSAKPPAGFALWSADVDPRVTSCLFAALAIAPALALRLERSRRSSHGYAARPQEETLEFEDRVHSYALDLSELGSGWALASIYPNSCRWGWRRRRNWKAARPPVSEAALPGGDYAQGDLARDRGGGTRSPASASASRPAIRNRDDGFAVFWMNAFTGDERLLLKRTG